MIDVHVSIFMRRYTWREFIFLENKIKTVVQPPKTFRTRDFPAVHTVVFFFFFARSVSDFSHRF